MTISDELRSQGRIGNALTYETTIGSLEKFRPGCKLINVTISFLREYEKWMIERKRSITTVAIHLRTLRAIINRAIADKQFNILAYPFGRNKYLIPEGNSKKRALSKDNLHKIFNYRVANDDYFKIRSLDFWKFTYLANGINMMDIAHLKWKDIEDESILFSRAKTRRTIKKAVSPIVVVRNHIINRIIEAVSS